jgi:glucosamine--fructose-6-phosphate aminotransferase (isomerizing)
MWSSFFISEIWNFFLRNIAFNKKCYSYSSDEINNNFPFLDESDFIITFSQSGNTKEVSSILMQLIGKNIKNFSFTNNLNWDHIKLSTNNLVFDIWLEKSPVSTKYVIYSILFLYKLSVIYWNINNTVSLKEKNKYIKDLYSLNSFSENIFEKYDTIITDLTNKFSLGDNFIIIWNWLNYFISKEISLKIRETSWINCSYDSIWQLNHWWINSINNKTICIILEKDEQLLNKIIERWWKIITIWICDSCDIKIITINKFIDIVQKIILLQYFVHKLSCSQNINTDIKVW